MNFIMRQLLGINLHKYFTTQFLRVSCVGMGLNWLITYLLSIQTLNPTKHLFQSYIVCVMIQNTRRNWTIKQRRFFHEAVQCTYQCHESRKRHLRQPYFSKGLTKLAILPDYDCPGLICLALPARRKFGLILVIKFFLVEVMKKSS